MDTITNLEQLLAASAPRVTDVTVGTATVRVRELSVAGRDEFLDAAKEGNAAAAVTIVRLCVVDLSGRPLMTQEDAEKLADQSGKFVQTLAERILKMSGLSEDDAGNGDASQMTSDSSTA
jgi:hypothetical protein